MAPKVMKREVVEVEEAGDSHVDEVEFDDHLFDELDSSRDD